MQHSPLNVFLAQPERGIGLSRSEKVKPGTQNFRGTLETAGQRQHLERPWLCLESLPTRGPFLPSTCMQLFTAAARLLIPSSLLHSERNRIC